jgi:hypothetical protein
MHPLNLILSTPIAVSDQHRGTSSLSDTSLNSPWAPKRADTGALWAYPSPPMSGSPPPSQKAPPVAGDGTQRPIGHLPPAPHHDAYRLSSNRPPSIDPRSSQGQPPNPEPYGRLSRHELMGAPAYGYQQQSPHNAPPRPLSYPPQGLPSLPQAQPFSPATGSGAQIGYAMSGRAHPSDTQPFATSPKSQRKVKGHVASACVPCKRAHLR